MKPEPQEQYRDNLRARCAECGETYGLHGAFDGRCPSLEKVAGEWVPAETFFQPQQSK